MSWRQVRRVLTPGAEKEFAQSDSCAGIPQTPMRQLGMSVRQGILYVRTSRVSARTLRMGGGKFRVARRRFRNRVTQCPNLVAQLSDLPTHISGVTTSHSRFTKLTRLASQPYKKDSFAGRD